MSKEAKDLTGFREGGLYYMLWYADDDLLYLDPDAIVFTGKNLDPTEQSSEAWYFQDAESYCEEPPASRSLPLEPLEEGEPQGTLYRLREAELEQVTDLDGLAAEIENCRQRRIKAGLVP